MIAGSGPGLCLTVMGLRESVFILLAAASMATFAGVTIFLLAGSGVGWIYPVGAAVLGYFLLLKPASYYMSHQVLNGGVSIQQGQLHAL